MTSPSVARAEAAAANPSPSALAERSAAASPAERIVAVDILRGLVLFFLLPDLAGGFSFYRMAERYPDHWAWQPLATLFTHVEWSGVALWDLVMPLFVFLVGVSMALSYEKRSRAGQGDRELLGHAVLRSLTLLVLGLLLQFSVKSRFDELLPYFVLAIGLPLGTWWHRVAGRGPARASASFGVVYAIGILLLALVWMAAHVEQLGNWQLGNQILVQMGLAYLPAFLMLRYGLRVQAAVAAVIVAVYGLAFVLYAPPASVVPVGEAWSGLWGHWNNGTNLAAAFDRWFLNLLPREAAYAGNPHGYHTLGFVPLVAVMLAGAIAGRLLAREGATRALALRLGAAAVAGLAFSWLMAASIFPLVKSLWTPSWTVFSISACLLLLAAVIVFSDSGRSWLARSLTVLGTNSILLYVIAFTEHWRLEALWQRLLGSGLGTSLAWWPVLQSCLVLVTLWALAWLLFRLRIFVRV